MTDDLAALARFVSERLDELEQAAYGLCGDGAHIAEWLLSGDEFVFVGTNPLPEKPIAQAFDARVGRWIVMNDPARALREVAAKRALLAEAQNMLDNNMSDNPGARWLADDILRHLAAVWSDHPDYRKEWAS